ncbi:MAG: ABC transporter ATP-binding protein, partial [Chloroflexota bacterium]
MIGGSGGPLFGGGGGRGAWGTPGLERAVVDGRAFDTRVMARLWGYLRPFRRQLWWTVLLVVINAAMQLIGPYLLKVAIDDHIIARTDFPGLSVVSLLFAGTLLVTFLTQSRQSYTMAYVAQHVLTKMRGELFAKLNRLPLAYHDRHESGVTMSRIVNDVAVFQELLTQGAVNVIADLLILAGIITIMVLMSPLLALYTLSVLPVMALATVFFTSRARQAFLRTRETIGEVAAGFQENVSGVRVVQAFTREQVSQSRFDAINLGNRRANLGAVLLASAFPPIVEFMGMLATAIVLWFGAEAAQAGMVTVGVVVAFLTYVTRFFQPIRELAQVYSLFQQTMAAGEKIFELLDTPLTVDDRPGARELPPIEGEVEFRNVA